MKNLRTQATRTHPAARSKALHGPCAKPAPATATATAAVIAKGLFCVSLAVAFIGGTFHDAAISATKHTWDLEARNDCRNIEANALVISHLPRRYYCHFMGDKGRIAIYLKGRESFDAGLVDWHLERNRPVYTDKETATFIKDDRAAQGYAIAPDPRAGGGLYRIGRALDGKPQP